MNDQHTKTLNTSGGKNRIKFSSSKKRSRQATADVYRRKKSGREHAVHNTPDDEISLSLELDLAMDRNASEIFRKFYRELWILVRSLPEVLHHTAQILDLMLAYMLSPEDAPGEKTTGRAKSYVVNQATLDILHLLSVLARDLRHELHPFLHKNILPRIVQDLLNRPTGATQEIPLDVAYVEAAFRTLSYIFRYDTESLLNEKALESMRQYYGATLANRRDLVRRLSAEAFAPLIRKLPDSDKKKHLKRVLKAIVSVSKINNNRKLYLDAVDGIAGLFLEVARGAVGKLHSKGGVAIKVILDSAMQETVVFDIASAFLERFCNHLTDTKLVLLPLIEGTVKFDDSKALCHFLRLLQMIIRHRSGKLLNEREASQQLEGLLRKLLGGTSFNSLSRECKNETLNLFCLFWTQQAENEAVALVLTEMIKGIMLQTIEVGCTVACFVIQNVIPHVSTSVAMGTIGSVALSQAAALDDTFLAVTLIHCLATTRTREVSSVDDDRDDVFFLNHAAACNLASDECETLLKSCLIDNTTMLSSQETCARFLASCSSAAFVALTGGDSVAMTRITTNSRTVLRWLLQKLQYVDESLANDASSPLILTLSILIELLSKVSLASVDFMEDSSVLRSVLKTARPLVLRNLIKNRESLWILKATSQFVEALSSQDLLLSEDADAVFEALTPRLRSKNHFARLHCLRILCAFPKRPFVVDHADLDLTDDLDDEVSPLAKNRAHTGGAGPTGPCDIMDKLQSIESCPVSLTSQRRITSLISAVGVLGRTGKLPVVYAEAAASHLLGILYIKFALVWPVAVQSLIDLCKGHEDCVWLPLHQEIDELMGEYVYAGSHDDIMPKDSSSDSISVVDACSHFSLCQRWDVSHGMDAQLFSVNSVCTDESGKVSRHQCTDKVTVVESLWQVAAGAPHLVTAHSRTLVPIFIDFMHYQFYGIHETDPDIRELQLHLHISQNVSAPVSGRRLDSSVVQRLLVAILKAFARVRTKQLLHHELLLMIFQCLMGNQDTATAQLAFSCVLNYKVQHIVPYADLLKSLFEKGKFRDALMNVDAAIESGTLLNDHREGFISVLCRIVFGRLSVRAIGSKSSKDSPATRRNAVLSLLASLSQNDDELYSFLYLMIRAYVPKAFDLKPVDLQNRREKQQVLECITSLSVEECLELPTQVHHGFLNVLGAAISQLGRKLIPYVPTFVSVVVLLCRAFEVRDQTTDGRILDVDGTDGEHKSAERRGAVRSLCYNRLADFVSQFSEECDFAPYCKLLWGPLRHSLDMLPAMATHSDHAPSLLRLLKTISSKKALVQVLSASDRIVPSVLRCLSVTNNPAAVDEALSFVDNLIPGDNDEPSRGRGVIMTNLELLLEQLRLRLCGETNSGGLRSASWRRELFILCRVSMFIQDDKEENTGLSTLCELLFPFVGATRGVSDPDKQMILDILVRVLPKVPRETAPTHFRSLSLMLGLTRGKPSLESRLLRKSVADALASLSASVFPDAAATSSALKELCAVSQTRLNEMDYDRVIPVLSELENTGDSSQNNTWPALSKRYGAVVPSILLPLVCYCFNLLFDDDGVVSRGAFKALKSLILFVTERIGSDDVAEDEAQSWARLLEGTIISMTRTSLTTKHGSARRFLILIVRDIAWACRNDDSPNRYSDLSCLVREDEPDQDFFLNITHVQVHRRARALQRLRRHLCDPESPKFSQQSLSNVLLPLVTHFVYESKTNIDQTAALEATATAGAIARNLSWSKYNSYLWTHLNQFDRHPQQEQYLVGVICAVVDGFHFALTDEKSETELLEKDSLKTNSVWRALETRIIPKIEGMISKKTENRGKILRPSVVLALFKLLNKLPTEIFRSRLPRLLTVICDALGNQESNSREVARKALAKMVTEMDIVYLSDVLRELATSLTEGYKLHVRTATLHSLLTEMSTTYQPHESHTGGVPTFDKNLPGFLDLIQQDLFGHAQERRDAHGSQVRYVKEAAGSKAEHCLELLARMIQFSPVVDSGGHTFSSIHLLTEPFLSRLRSQDTTTIEMKRSKECLSRIVTGLLKNPSKKPRMVLHFVHATLKHFMAEQEINAFMDTMNDGSSDDEQIRPIRVSGSIMSKKKDRATKGEVVEWRPSQIHSALTTTEARDAKKKNEEDTKKVADGFRAPRLTGSYRSRQSTTAVSTVNDPASISAVVFCLKLLSPALRYEWEEVDRDLLDAFVPILTICVYKCRDMEVILMALKCLGWLSRSDLPSLSRCSRSLSIKALEFLVSAGANQELLQESFKTLTFLMKNDHAESEDLSTQPVGWLVNKPMPLDSDQLDVLVSFLRESVVKSDHFNAAIALIRTIMSRGYLSPEFYDLMDTLLEQSVRSHRTSLRDQCGVVILNYIINYPLSPAKLEKHLKQIILNVNYELVDGRLSAIKLVKSLFDKLPEAVVEQHSQLFFLPLTLQLANDESAECREAISNCLGSLLRRLSTPSLKSIYEYAMKWAEGETALHCMALQLFSIFVDLRTDFVQTGTIASDLVKTTLRMMDDEEWETIYFAVVLSEKILENKIFGDLVVSSTELWRTTNRNLSHIHPWVRLAACRLLSAHLQDIDPAHLSSSNCFLNNIPAGLHLVARNLCNILDVDEQSLNEELVNFVTKNLTWCLKAMNEHPELCYEERESNGDPIRWVLARLSQIAKKKGRRSAVFKCFAKFVDAECDVFDYLELMLEPLHRSELEARNESTEQQSDLVQNVLYLIEERADESTFLKAYSNVKAAAQAKKEERNQAIKQVAISDPLEFAKKRIEKQVREKKRRKRRMNEKKTNTRKRRK